MKESDFYLEADILMKSELLVWGARTASPWLKPNPCAYCGSISTVSSPFSFESGELK